MSILITILSIIAALVVLLLVIALFVQKEYTVVRDTTIARPVSQVFDYIKYIKNQDNYSVWNQLDPGMKKTYSGTDGTVGFMYAWDSNNKKAGKGEQQIILVKDGVQLDTDLHFIKPFEGRAIASLLTAPVADGKTKLTWSIYSKMNYPMNIMLLFMNMDKMLGTDLEKNLANLKALLEK